jgi:hypothetical protein
MRKSDSAALGTAVPLTPLWHAQWYKPTLLNTVSFPMIRSTVFYAKIWLGYIRHNMCHWHLCDIHSGIIDTIVTCTWHRCDFGSHVQEVLATFKGNIYRKNTWTTYPTLLYIYNFHTHKKWVLVKDTAVAKIGDFVVDFLCEFEAIFKKVFNPFIRGLRGVFDEKTRGHNSLVGVPLTSVCNDL